MKLPKFPTFFTVCALIVLLSFGTWQVKRLAWKNNLIGVITAHTAMPVVEYSGGNLDIDAWQYRMVVVHGHFLHDKEIHLFTGPREMRGDPGYDILTPLERADGSVVLIDRGWVPHKNKEQSTRPETLLRGEIAVAGMLHAGEHRGMFIPDNDIAKNLWFWIDMQAVSGFAGKVIDNVYVRVVDDGSGENIMPIPGKAVVEIRNNHLEYAITWYSLAVILAVIYYIYVRKSNLQLRE